MFYILLFIHCFLCVVLIGLVLIQQGKGADMGAAWGGSSASVFGASGAADFLTKFTTSIAVSFMVTSVLLVRAYSTFVGSVSSVENPLEGSVMGEVAPPVQEAPPAQPAASEPAAPAAAAASGEVKVVEKSAAPPSTAVVPPAPESKPAEKPADSKAKK